MSGRFENTFPGFVVTHEAWYAETALRDNCYAEIAVGFYSEDGGTAGEFMFRWRRLRRDEPSCRLETFDDSWSAFLRMPELMRWMRKWDQTFDTPTPTPEDLVSWLKMNGFRDLTKYDSPFAVDAA
jgi:hypothetical protein